MPYFHALLAEHGRAGTLRAIISCDEFRQKFLSAPFISRALLDASERAYKETNAPPCALQAELYPIPVVVLGHLYYVYDFPPYQSLKWICEELNRDEYGLFSVVLKNSPTIVDVGAHVGLFSLAARTRWPKARIVSFEPFPATYRLLTENIRINDCANIEAHNLGISSDGRRIELYSRLNENSGGTSSWSEVLDSVRAISGNTSRFIDALNDNNIDMVDLLKIDCEGFEHEILVDDFPFERIKHLAIEIHEGHYLSEMGYSSDILLERIQNRLGPDRVSYTIAKI